MFDLSTNSKKIATKIGASVTILVLFAACSSKQIVNEASVAEPVDYADTVADQNAYVDQSELPTREVEQRKVSQKRVAKKVKKARGGKKIARKTNKAVEKKEELKLDEATMPAIGSIENTNPPVPPPPPPAEELIAESSLNQPLFEDEGSMDFSGLILENWYYLLALLGLGAAGYFGFKAYQKRFSGRRKSKRRLVFN